MNRKYIMIIDDDKITIELYKMMVEMISANGYVTMELNPLKALDDLKNLNEFNDQKFPDYILLDISMPEMNGFDFLDRFLERFPDKKSTTSFIITTSSFLEKDKQRADNLDYVKDFIIKPIPVNYIEKLINGSG